MPDRTPLSPLRWRLIYTTAPDVKPLLFSERPLPFQVGNIYQEFSSVERGEVQNIIEFRVPLLLREGEGHTHGHSPMTRM